MKKIILSVCLLFVSSVFAQESIPPDFPAEFPGAFEPSVSPEVVQPPQELPQLEVPQNKKIPVKEPKAVPEARIRARTEESKVFLDFRDADIKDVAVTLSKISGVSILVGENVKAKVTLNIEGVTWKRALELILRTYNLAMIEKDDFIIVVTYKKIQEEQDQIPLDTDIMTLNFVDIEEAKTYLQSVMSKRGSIAGDPRTNSLIITDIPEFIEKAKNIVRRLDKKTPQVLIEVLMIDKKVEDDVSFGIDWSFTNTKNEGTNLAKSISQTLQLAGSNAIAVAYGKTMFGHNRLETTLEALSLNEAVDVIANPKILTLDNITANIEIIEQIPYTSESSSTEGSVTSTQFKDTGVTLSVKPHITPDGHIILDVETKQSFRTGFTPDNEPIIDSRISKSTMMILDGQTIVIGGLRKKDDTSTITKVPFLGDIPLLGKLFSRKVSAYITREFLIFITPTIIKEPLKVAEASENKKALKKQVLHEKEMLKTARTALKYDNFTEEEDLEEKQQKPESKQGLSSTQQKQKETKRKLAEFDSLDILPLKGPDEAN